MLTVDHNSLIFLTYMCELLGMECNVPTDIVFSFSGLALRGGVELFRTNELIAPTNQRAFVGPVAAAAFEQYAFGAILFNVDVRYGLIGSGPTEIAALVGASISVR